MSNKIETDWQLVVNMNPQGFLKFSNGKDRTWQGKLSTLSIDPKTSEVTIKLEWCATIATTPEGKPLENSEWKQCRKRRLRFQNRRLPFTIEALPKGTCVKFAHNELYIENAHRCTEIQDSNILAEA